MNRILSHKYGIFITAILISIACHIFWLSSVKIIAASPKKQSVKFSKVSFLGPILERGAIELSVQPKDRALLEKRYLSTVGKLRQKGKEPDKMPMHYGGEDGMNAHDGGRLAPYIEDALSTAKLEPEGGME